MRKYFLYRIMIVLLISMTFACVPDKVIKKDSHKSESKKEIIVYQRKDKTVREEQNIKKETPHVPQTIPPEKPIEKPISPSKKTAHLKSPKITIKPFEIKGFSRNLTRNQLAEINHFYDLYLSYRQPEASKLVSELGKKIVRENRDYLLEVYFAIIKNNKFNRLLYQTRKGLITFMLKLAYESNSSGVQAFIQKHITDEGFVDILNIDRFVLSSIRDYAYVQHNEAAESVYNKIIRSLLLHNLSEKARQWEIKKLWQLYETHPDLKEKINRLWEYLYHPENFIVSEPHIRYMALDILLEKITGEESDNDFLKRLAIALLSRNVLEHFSQENRAYVLYNVFTYALNDRFFNDVYFNRLLDKTLSFSSQKDIEWFKDIYVSAADYMNYLHDMDAYWEFTLAEILRQRSDRELYFFLSVASYGLYNATFQLLYDEEVRRVKAAGGLFPWLRKADKDNTLISMLFLALSGRNKFIEFIETSVRSKKQEKVNDVLKMTCDLIKKETELHSQTNDYENRKYLSYISYAVEDLFKYDNPEVSRYLASVISDMTRGNFLSNVFARAIMKKYPKPFSGYVPRSTKADKIIADILAYLDRPPYESIISPEKRVLVLVDFADSAEDFIHEQKSILGTNMRQPDDAQRKKGIVAIYYRKMGDIIIEYHLAIDIIGERFRRIIEENHYSLVFTRHHSYENDLFVGQGADTIIPQIWAVIGTGYGKINNHMTLILTEEIVRAYLSGGENWDKIIKRVNVRIRQYFEDINFLYPNSLSLIISYASLLSDSPYNFGKNKVIFYDGACAGGVRSPMNVVKYKNSMVQGGK